MTCRELVELLFDYVVNELPPTERQEMEQHLCLCPSCMVYAETYRTVVRLSRRLPRQAAPTALVERLQAALRAGEPRQQPPSGGMVPG